MLTEHQNYYMQLVRVDGDDESGYLIYRTEGTNTQDPIRKESFSSAEKAYSWWFYQCEQDPALVEQAKKFAFEANRWRSKNG